MIVFRNTDVDVPFFWESARQPAQRWHGDGEGPAQYMSSTPDASWAELLRDSGIVEPDDLAGIVRTMWAVEIDDREPTGVPALPMATLTGDPGSYPACQQEARRLRGAGPVRLIATSAAVLTGTPSGWVSATDLAPGPPREESTIVLFGARPTVIGWVGATLGQPEPSLLDRVRYL